MELKSLSEIFNDQIFRIPDYQRGFSWGERHWHDMWRDVYALRRMGGDHYTGVISAAKKTTAEGTVHSIVDGQQRLATLIIMIHVLCNCKQLEGIPFVNGREKTAYNKKYLFFKTGKQGEITQTVFGYDADNPSHEHFRTKILGIKGVKTDDPENTFYTRNLTGAKEFFEGLVEKSNRETAEKLLENITQNLKFNYYQIDSELNEFVAFETMNNRGKPLSTLELLKNRLIYLSTLFGCDDGEKNKLRKDINNAWKTVYAFLGKRPENVLDDDDFLRNHWIAYFQYNSKKSYKEFLLNEHFTSDMVRDGNLQYSDIREYAVDIQKSIKAYYYMHNPGDTEASFSSNATVCADIKEWLFKLNRLGFGAFEPIIMSALTNGLESRKVLRILKFAEQFVFVVTNIRFYRSDKKKNAVYGWAGKYHKSPDDLTDGEIGQVFSLNNLGISDKFRKARFIDDIVTDSEEGFYAWKGVEYFLYEYEIHLQESAGGELKVQWENINVETIEHIYPQSPCEGWGEFNSPELLHDLGNLLLLSHRRNATLQNSSFKDKKEHCKGYRHGSHSEIEVAENKYIPGQSKNWTPETVIARRKKMLAFLVQRWGLKAEDSEAK